jgi:FKBP-type peptidyl-prolyl cis-trans isomerase
VKNKDGSLGAVFDSSYERDEPFFFELGQNQVIKGWEDAIVQMTKGERATVTIPPELGYGSEGVEGVIPSAATLQFIIEILDFKQ